MKYTKCRYCDKKGVYYTKYSKGSNVPRAFHYSAPYKCRYCKRRQ